MQKLQLMITGHVSITPNPRRSRVHDRLIMIMGPTGSGKSTFIEALAGKDQPLGISKDQLAGFTQKVTAYKVVNTEIRYPSGESYPVWLIDTPGFSDTKISELEIVREAKNWIEYVAETAMIDIILYLCPITDTRVPGSKRRTIQMLQALFQTTKGSAPRVIILTTMWDRLGNPHARERAEKHFAQLQNDIWKDVVSRGGNIARFDNMRESALEVLKVSVENPYAVRDSEDAEFPLMSDPITGDELYFPLLYQELLDRINGCQQEIKLLQMEEALLTTNPDPQLAAVVIPKIHEIEQDLAKFGDQLADIGILPERFAFGAAQVINQYLLTGLTGDTREDDAKLGAAIKRRLGELKALKNDRGVEFVGSCWPHLHPKAKFIIFDNLVGLIMTRQQKGRTHCLEPLQQIMTVTSPVALRFTIVGVNWHVNVNKDEGKLRWQLENFGPPPQFAKVRAQLIYRYLLDDVNDAKGIVQILQDALNRRHGQSDDVKQCKAVLKEELAAAKDTLAKSALALIQYGSPPKGYKRVAIDYRYLPVKVCVAHARWIAKGWLGMKS